jgi:hypothetical protein
MLAITGAILSQISRSKAFDQIFTAKSSLAVTFQRMYGNGD